MSRSISIWNYAYIVFSSKTLTKIITWILWIWVIWHRWLHWFHNMLSIASIYEFTISHPWKMNGHFFIVMFFRVTDIKIHRMLKNERKNYKCWIQEYNRRSSSVHGMHLVYAWMEIEMLHFRWAHNRCDWLVPHEHRM